MLLVAAITPTYAQQQQVPMPNYKLTVTPEEIDMIGDALGNLPYAKVLPLINKLRLQVIEQQQAAQAKPVEEKKE